MVTVTPGDSVAKLVVAKSAKTPDAGNVESGKKAEKPAKGDSLRGLLVTITIDKTDATKATLVVGKDKKETITVDSTTKITKDKAEAKLADLKVGDNSLTVLLRLSLDQKTVQ